MTNNKIVIIGGGGFLGNLINYINSQDLYEIYGYTDRTNNGTILGIKYLGNDEVLPKLYSEGIQIAVIGVGIKPSGSRLKKELEGESVLSLEENRSPKKAIATTRSFEKNLIQFEDGDSRKFYEQRKMEEIN